jgi:hypothetical protein
MVKQIKRKKEGVRGNYVPPKIELSNQYKPRSI